MKQWIVILLCGLLKSILLYAYEVFLFSFLRFYFKDLSNFLIEKKIRVF